MVGIPSVVLENVLQLSVMIIKDFEMSDVSV